MNSQHEDKYKVGDIVAVDHWGTCEIIEVRHPNRETLRGTVYTVKMLDKICVYEDDIEFSYGESDE